MLSIRRTTADGLPVAIVAVAGVACCAAVPAIATLLGGLALGAALGVAGGALLAAALLGGAVVAVRARRRRRSSTSIGESRW